MDGDTEIAYDPLTRLEALSKEVHVSLTAFGLMRFFEDCFKALLLRKLEQEHANPDEAFRALKANRMAKFHDFTLPVNETLRSIKYLATVVEGGGLTACKCLFQFGGTLLAYGHQHYQDDQSLFNTTESAWYRLWCEVDFILCNSILKPDEQKLIDPLRVTPWNPVAIFQGLNQLQRQHNALLPEDNMLFVAFANLLWSYVYKRSATALRVDGCELPPELEVMIMEELNDDEEVQELREYVEVSCGE